VVDIFEFAIPNINLIHEDKITKWCGEDNINDFQGSLHPLIPEIMKLYFGTEPPLSIEKVEQDSKKVFWEDRTRAKQTRPVDELDSEIINGGQVVN
jgi:hypothetical protein